MSAPRLDATTAHLEPFVAAGLLDRADVHVAATVARRAGDADPLVVLGVAFAARAPRLGHVCVDFADVARTAVVADGDADGDGDDGATDDVATGRALEWPDPTAWAAALAASPITRTPADPRILDGVVAPLVLDGTRCWLDRYFEYERRVADRITTRVAAAAGCLPDGPDLDAALLAALPDFDDGGHNRQRDAARVMLTRRFAVVAGGPGTGKTRTIAATIAVARSLQDPDRPLQIALAAPTGKAAARMTEAVAEAGGDASTDPTAGTATTELTASTLHRLLGGRPDSPKFRYHRTNPLPHDLVIVDETSMVSLPLMAHLLDAVRPDATVVLVGDPYQLVSIEAGAVLGEIVGPVAEGRAAGGLADHVVVLDRALRFPPGSPIARLADGIRTGDAAAVTALLDAPPDGDVTWIDPADTSAVDALLASVGEHATGVVEQARAGDATAGLAAAGRLKVLTATRFGDLGRRRVTERIEAALTERFGDGAVSRGWYVGRPVIVTANDYRNRLFNGDVGLLAARPEGGPAVAFAPDGRMLTPSQLADVETWWAMTIHKSQGSEFDHVVVTLPPPPSPILTRELLYTAVTRARSRVTLVASRESIESAITTPVQRASGLRAALWGADATPEV